MLDVVVFAFLMFVAGSINLVVMLFTAFKLKILYAMSGTKMSVKSIYDATMVAHLFNTIAPYGTGSMIIRPLVLKKISDVRYEKSITVNVIEHAFDILSGVFALVFSIVFIGSFGLPLESVVFTVAIILVFMLFMLYTKWSIVVAEKVMGVTKILPKRLKSFSEKRGLFRKRNVLDTIESMQNTEGKGMMIIGIFFLCFGAMFVQAISSYAFFLGMGVNVDYLQAFALFWLPFFIGRVSNVPGGVGVREGGMVYLLHLFGVEISQAIVLAVLYRLLVTSFAFTAGLLISFKLGINIFKLRKQKSKK